MGIKIEAPTREEQEADAKVIPIELGDDELEFVVPKSNKLIKGFRKAAMQPKGEQDLTIMAAQYNWLEQGFGEETWGWLEDRLDDDEDWLQNKHLDKIFEELMEEISDRPTTSRRNSSGPPRRNKPPVKRSLEVSDSES